MQGQNSSKGDIGEVRDDFVPASDYISPDFAALEDELLWPRVWQMACREEDIPEVGDFHTYEIVDESIVVVRTAPDEVKAFYNVCPHRGNRLVAGCGHVQRFRCSFHGWQFNLDGSPHYVVDRDDWGDKLPDEEISLSEVKVGRYLTLSLEANSEDAARMQLNEMCEKLLANPITENFELRVTQQ